MDEALRQQVEDLIFMHFPHTPTLGQQDACHELVEFVYDPDPNAAFMLKGYAGTGKTTLIGALIRTAPYLKLRTVLLAPTGRAAKVLSGYSGKKAYTIHKKIYTTVFDVTGSPHMERAINKHSYTLFIVDEASMIGVGSDGVSRHNLLEDLLDYVASGNHCRVMFVGDTAQLPPVGDIESPALDADYLMSLAPLKLFCSELTEVVRQQQMSGILHNATLLRNTIMSMDDFDEVELPLFELSGFSDIVRLHGSDLEEVLNQEYRDYSIEALTLITRSNKRANMFNQGIRNRVLFREELVNAGDYLMVVKNNYHWLEPESDIGFIANGDIVEVLGIRNVQEMYGFNFADATLRFVDYPGSPTQDCKLLLDTLLSESPSLTYDEHQRLHAAVMEDYMDIPSRTERMRMMRKDPYYNALQVKFAYSLTCHKTQGGQWDTVIIDQGYLTDDMIGKEYLRWLYTALTRATGKVYLLNFEDKFFVEDDLE